MMVWAVTATVAAVGLLMIIILYRRQVKKTCRQLAFIRENDTNRKLRSEGGFPELDLLREEINGILEQTRGLNRETMQKEELFKETITNISHDIRTPLTSLDGYFQLLRQETDEAACARYSEVIKERIASLNAMLEELFTYTKLQNKKYELAMEEMDFGKCVYDTVFSFYEEFKGRKIEPELALSEGSYIVQGNREAIRRVLQNIIKNALEHGKAFFAMRLYEEQGWIVFTCDNDVEDAEQIDMSQVFTRFYKADSARTCSSTGLGLSIAKELTEKMGGILEAGLTESVFKIKVRFCLSEEKTQKRG